MEITEVLKEAYKSSDDKMEFINSVRVALRELSPERANPVDCVLWVNADDVVANNYNPNSVAPKEMKLLYTSIKEDGYTQPIVTFYDKELKKYVIVDGFHRNLVLRLNEDIAARCHGRLPIVVIDKDIDQRMASTVRHNRARGSHSVDGMVNIAYKMLKDGKSEKEICDKLGMDQREFVKMGYITGFAKIFKGYSFNRSIDTFIPDDTLKEELAAR